MWIVARIKPRTFSVRVLVTLYAYLASVLLLEKGHPASLGRQLACAFVGGFLTIAAGIIIERQLERTSALARSRSLKDALVILRYDLNRYLEEKRLNRLVAKLQHRASETRRDVLRAVVRQIDARDRMMKFAFRAERKKLLSRTSLLAVTVLEDDSDPTAYLLVVGVLRGLGFIVNASDENAAFSSVKPHPVWHFERVKTDYLVVGPNFADNLVRQFIQEVHTWEAPPTLRVSEVFDNDDIIAEVFGPVFQDLSPEFSALARSQLWMSLRFWQAYGERRHRLSESRDPRSSRSRSGNS